MKFTSAFVMLSAAGVASAAKKDVAVATRNLVDVQEFVTPDKLKLTVKVRTGKVCDADGWGRGASDAFVKVYAELPSGSKKYCGKTSTKEDNTPTWNQIIDCGEISKDDWGAGIKIYFDMQDADIGYEDDGLGRGTTTKTFIYGERYTSKYSFSSSYGSECGTSTIYYSVYTPSTSAEFCLQTVPNGDYFIDKIDGSYHSIHSAMDAYEDKGYEIGYPGQVKTIAGEQVVLDAACNHHAPKVVFCVRPYGDIGDATKVEVDQEILAIMKSSIGVYQEVFDIGDRVDYLGGTGVVTAECTCIPDGPSSYGDPHFRTWNGEQFDFHGGCDLVLLSNPGFNHGLGMDIHVRTKIFTWWSLIESAALKIGDNTLQIQGGTSGSIKYWINGEEKELQTGNTALGDFPVTFKRVNDHQSQTRVDLGKGGDAISIESFKNFVRVNINDKKKANFVGSTGLLGSYPTGEKVGRDGKTKFADDNAFGQEWQVGSADEILFSDVDAGALQLICAMPEQSMAEGRRRLGESAISEEDAAKACARVSASDRDACIFDVLATNDADMAGSY